MTTTVPIDDDHPDFEHLAHCGAAAVIAADDQLSARIRELLGLGQLALELGRVDLLEVALADARPLIEARRELRELVTR